MYDIYYMVRWNKHCWTNRYWSGVIGSGVIGSGVIGPFIVGPGDQTGRPYIRGGGHY